MAKASGWISSGAGRFRGELKQLIEKDGLSGVTSNPSIFEKAMAGSHDYDDAIRKLALEGKSVDEIYAASRWRIFNARPIFLSRL